MATDPNSIATNAQREFLVRLADQQALTEEHIARVKQVAEDAELTRAVASEWIDELRALPRRGSGYFVEQQGSTDPWLREAAAKAKAATRRKSEREARESAEMGELEIAARENVGEKIAAESSEHVGDGETEHEPQQQLV